MTKSADFNNKKANEKLIIIVVMVKNKFGTACRHFLYLNINKGSAPSINQKKVKPPTRIMLRWSEGIVSK